jgi:hypothetical protein
MDVKAEIDKLEQEALDVVAEAKNEADAIIESSADKSQGIYDDAARLVAEAEAKAAELHDKAKALAKKYLDVVEDVVEDVEEFVEESKGFFAKNKLFLGIAAAVVVVVVVAVAILI